MAFEFNDDNLKSVTRFTPLVPPTTTLEDGSLEITGWVQDVSWTGYKFDEQRNNAMFTFSNKDGDSITKFIQDPLTKPHIANLDDSDPKKDTLAGLTYFEVVNLAKRFIKDNLVTELAKSLGKGINIQLLSEGLFELTKNPANLKPTENILLKVGFYKATGTEPKYTVPQSYYDKNTKTAYNYLGSTTDSEKYQLKWNNVNGQYSDIKNFAFVETTDTFAASAPLDLPFDDINLG